MDALVFRKQLLDIDDEFLEAELDTRLCRLSEGNENQEQQGSYLTRCTYQEFKALGLIATEAQANKDTIYGREVDTITSVGDATIEEFKLRVNAARKHDQEAFNAYKFSIGLASVAIGLTAQSRNNNDSPKLVPAPAVVRQQLYELEEVYAAEITEILCSQMGRTEAEELVDEVLRDYEALKLVVYHVRDLTMRVLRPAAVEPARNVALKGGLVVFGSLSETIDWAQFNNQSRP